MLTSDLQGVAVASLWEAGQQPGPGHERPDGPEEATGIGFCLKGRGGQ